MKLTAYKQNQRAVRRVLRLVSGYLSVMDPDFLLAYDGGLMTVGELQTHVRAALKLKLSPPSQGERT